MIDALRHSAAHVFVDNIASPALSVQDQHHLEKVLRLRSGQKVTCSDGVSLWRECVWNGSHLDVIGGLNSVSPCGVLLSVAIAPLKGDRTDLVVEKLVEIGIDRIVLLEPMDHSVVRWSSDKVGHVMERYQRIARAASMQSRRISLPAIEGPINIADLATDQLAFAEPGSSGSWDHVRTLVIGPEGGFSVAEIAKAPATVSLGSGILRAETAAIVGATLMIAHTLR